MARFKLDNGVVVDTAKASNHWKRLQTGTVATISPGQQETNGPMKTSIGAAKADIT